MVAACLCSWPAGKCTNNILLIYYGVHAAELGDSQERYKVETWDFLFVFLIFEDRKPSLNFLPQSIGFFMIVKIKSAINTFEK